MRDLINKITAFLDRHDMEQTAFGVGVANDSHFVPDIKAGRKLRRKTVRKITDWMKAYRKPRK